MRRYVNLCVAGATAAALAGAAGPPLTTAASPPLTMAASPPVRHVVIIYLENHSFDNVLGYWCDLHRARCPDGGMPAKVKLSSGAVVKPTVDPDTIPNVTHSGPAQVLAMDNGKMDGWENIPPNGRQDGCGAQYSYRCISGYKPPQEPNFTALADKFAISDMTFSMSDSPSWEGHIYAVAASTDGFWGAIPRPPRNGTGMGGWGCDSDKVVTWFFPSGHKSRQPSCVPDYSLGLPNGGAFRQTKARYIPTIMDRLDKVGLTWKIYGATKGEAVYGEWDICPTFAECLYTSQYKRLVTNEQFASDVAKGRLPNFSVITPGGHTFADSCHNALSMTTCDNWVGQIVSEIENSRYWKTSAIFITFDDFGGFYDQVYPGTNSNPDGTQQGPRTPLIIVSPYAKPHYTDTTHTTFSGILAYTEHVFGLSSLGPNDALAYGFGDAFNYRQKPLQPVPMVTRPLPPSAKRIRITPALANDPS
jgi:phospholipase C